MAERVLVLAPHTDDGEFGCGGTIAKFVEEGKEVHYVAFSSCEQSVPQGFPEDVLVKEVKEATRRLGIPADHLRVLDFQVREFKSRRQDVLQSMIDIRKEIQPDTVFMPSLNDIHQDHLTVAEEGQRAFKHSCILCYEVPWNNFNFTTSSFVFLSEGQLNKKLKALSAYESQGHRNYSSPEFIQSLARTRGVQIGAPYAEAFEVLRWVIK